jgi:enoyl-CoA hydratase
MAGTSGAVSRGAILRWTAPGTPVHSAASAAAEAPIPFVEIEKPRPDVSLITLNRPERMNAMAFDVMIPLREALERVSHDNDTRVVVITGAGHGFCSGADLEDPGMLPNIAGLTVSAIARRAMELLDDVILALRRMHQPVIGAINGAAIGGGLCLSVAADIRIASERAYFRAAGINNGLTASELGLSYLLPRAIGASRAFEIMLSGRDVDAAEAERIGLVSRVVPHAELLGTCYELAGRIAGFSRVGVEATKRLLWSSLDAGSLFGHMDHEGHAQLYVRLTTQNFEEAIRARREKRPPVFKD